MLNIATIRRQSAFQLQLGLGLVLPAFAILAALTMSTVGVQAGEAGPVSVDAGCGDLTLGTARDGGSPDDRPIIPPTDLPSAVDCSVGSDWDAQPPSFDGPSHDPDAPAPLASQPPTHPEEHSFEPVTIARNASETVPRPHLRRFGVGIDVGISGVLPDAGLLLTARPVRWSQLQLGAGYNGLAPGVRGGLTLINPFVVPLSLTWEAGHYFEGDANRVVHWVDSSVQSNASLRRFGYDYMNLLCGLSIGDRDFAFHLRFGITWMRTTIHGFEQSVREATKLDLTASDPTIHYRGPALKVGFDYFL